MAVAYGQATFKGIKTGQTYSKDMYLADTANTNIYFDGNGQGASSTSPQKITFLEPVRLVDVCIVTGTAKTKITVNINGASTGSCLRQSCWLSSVTFRPPLDIVIPAGSELTMTELT